MGNLPTSTSTATVSSAPERLPLTARIVRHERAIVLVAIVVLAGLGAGWTASGAGIPAAEMAGMASMPAASALPFMLTVLMWWAMMTAMMLPSTTPAILLYARVRASHSHEVSIAPSGAFLGGYLMAWLAYSIAVAGLQGLATAAGWLDPMTMHTIHRSLAGGTLILVGLYQFSPAKNVCLTTCRSPASFMTRHWRAGLRGAVRLGLLQGTYCVGCCWLLMTLLFVGGVMNFGWIAALAALVAAEKLLPWGRRVSKGAGVVLIGWGIAIELA